MRRTTELKIVLKDDSQAFYSTHDQIQGHVSFQFEDDTVIDDLSISFEGKTTIRVEKHLLLSDKAGYTYGDHTFLKMSHPMQSSDLPDNRLAHGRKSYSVPFTFTVPETLLPYACTHATKGGSIVRKCHLLLPPSLGTSQTNDIFAEDISPDRARVAYSIQVRVRKHFPSARSITILRARPICILPAAEEGPPLFIQDNDPHYRLSHEKGVHQGLPAITRATGRLTASAAKLPSLMLPYADEALSNVPVSTVPVKLLFRPSSPGDQPPLLYSVSVKLLTFTFFGALPYKIIPRPEDSNEDRAEYSHYLSTTRLGNFAVKGSKWTGGQLNSTTTMSKSKQNKLDWETTRKSSCSSATTDEHRRPVGLTTCLQVPIHLPKSVRKPSRRKLLTPTFSSCLVSRAYTLELKLSYQAVGPNAVDASSTGSPNSLAKCLTPRCHLTLRLPLQIRLDPSSPSRVTPLQDIDMSERGSFQLDKALNSLVIEEQPPLYTPTLTS